MGGPFSLGRREECGGCGWPDMVVRRSRPPPVGSTAASHPPPASRAHRCSDGTQRHNGLGTQQGALCRQSTAMLVHASLVRPVSIAPSCCYDRWRRNAPLRIPCPGPRQSRAFGGRFRQTPAGESTHCTALLRQFVRPSCPSKRTSKRRPPLRHLYAADRRTVCAFKFGATSATHAIGTRCH